MMSKRMIAFLLCLSMIFTMFCAAVPVARAEGESEYHANIGRLARFDLNYTNFPIVSDPTNITAGDVFHDSIQIHKDVIPTDLVVEVVDCFVNEAQGIYWYQIKAAGDIPLPDAFPENPWVFQNYTGMVGGESLILLEDVPEETEPEEPETCPICGQVNCAVMHTWCDICETYDCGLTHLFCNLCGIYDCTKEHIWCGSCGKYDCDITHEEIYHPESQPVIPENPTLTEGAEVSLVDAFGNPVTSEGLLLPERRKLSLSAWTDLEGDVSYRWQICYDADADLWADIYGQTGKGILLSPAMIQSILDIQGTAAIRCVIASGEETRVSDSIPLGIMGQTSLLSLARTAGYGAALTADSGGQLEKAYLEVQYLYGDGRVAAAPVIAEIIPGDPVTPLNGYYKVPVIQGYVANLTHNPYPDYVQLQSVDNEQRLMVDIPANTIMGGTVQIIVTFVPTYVNYTVIHYQQNVVGDNYTKLAPETAEKLTGEKIENVHKEFPGFQHLIYETPAAAADNSTVIEIYYDRNYYLMKFTLGDQAYGVEPIYARYETPINIGTPSRPGYTFRGWVDGNKQPVDIPATMPIGGGTYYADWDENDTEYTVVYWIKEGDTKTYLGSKIVSGVKPGSVVNGTHDLNLDTNTCGMSEHTHGDDCGWSCGRDAHTHGDGYCLYNCGITFHDHTSGCVYEDELCSMHKRSCYQFTSSAKIANEAIQVDNAVYVTTANNFSIYKNGNYGWQRYVLINGSYYAITDYGNSLNNADLQYTLTCHTAHTAACCTVTYHDHPDCDCIVLPHIHEAGCRGCKTLEHTHSKSCKSELASFVDSAEADQNVTVRGDGSTVVNVYYEYRTYTIRFVYARSNTSGTTYYVADDTKDGRLDNCSWKEVSGKPTCEDPDKDGANTSRYFEAKDGNTTYRYYYISVTAQFGADITDVWPSANVSQIGNYVWGSWGAEHGSGYRVTYGNAHANIVGPYPVMSSDMIMASEQKVVDTGAYLAQTMIAWWGTTNAGIQAHSYHNYWEVLPGEEADPAKTVTYQGKQYVLAETYTFTAAHNGNTRVDPIFYSGYKCINDTVNTNNDKQANSSNYKIDPGECTICDAKNCSYHNNFYFDRNEHKLYFWNYNGLMMDGVGQNLKYGASLSAYQNTVSAAVMSLPENYPSDLEPNAYEFGGWYTTAECLATTEVNWNHKMPDSDMTIYAKWTPKEFEINLHLSPDLSQVYGSNTVKYGQVLGPIKDPEKEGYRFVGWFFMQDGIEYAFDPVNMPIKGEWLIYAKWTSDALYPYTIRFMTESDTPGGDPIEIAPAVTGSGIAGNTYTFEAKVGSELDFAYQTGHFPRITSHALTVQIPEEGQATDPNEFIFWYDKQSKVTYKVRYLDAKTGDPLEPEKIKESSNVTVTENFLYIPKHVPDYAQKTLVLSSDSAKNIIEFYYTYDVQNALYVVNHYVEYKVRNDEGEWVHGGWTRRDGTQGMQEIGSTVTASALTIEGYTLDVNATNTENDAAISDLNNGQLSGELTDQGLIMNFYYTPNMYPYEFRFWLSGTIEELAETVEDDAPYGATITQTAKQINVDLDKDGNTEDFQVYVPDAQTKYISIDGFNDVEVFSYSRATQDLTVKKVIDKADPSLHDPDSEDTFSFQLQIHADNFHKTSYSTNMGTKTPVFENGVYVLKFTLKAGEEITFYDLPTAEYTLTELDRPAAYSDTVYSAADRGDNGRYKLTLDHPVTVTVTNTYDPTVLRISKTVDVVEDEHNTPEVNAFEFTVTVPNGVTGTYSYWVGNNNRTATVEQGKLIFTIQDGETAQFENLPEGTYTVAETDYKSYGYNAYCCVNGGESEESLSGEVVLAYGATQTVAFTNMFPVGDLAIRKVVTKDYYKTPWSGDFFIFRVERTDRKLIPNNVYRYTVGGQEYGCTVDANGYLQVRIDFDQELANMLSTPGSVVSKSLWFRNLPVGTYKVTELTEDAIYAVTPESKYVDGLQIPQSTSPVAEFTNTVLRPTGDLSLEKYLVADPSHPDTELPTDLSFEFTFKLLDMSQYITDRTLTVEYVTMGTGGTSDQSLPAQTVYMKDGVFSLSIKSGQRITVKDLPVGSYTVTEARLPRYANEFFHWDWEVGNWVGKDNAFDTDNNPYTQIEVTALDEAKVKCVNTYPVDLADLTIQRTNAEADQVFVYEVRNAAGDITITVVIQGAGSATIRNLPLDTYTVTQKNNWSWRYGDSVQNNVVLELEGKTVTFGAAATNHSWINGNSEPVTNTKGR